jgi:hypothetical protein
MPPATKRAKTPTRKTPAVDTLRFSAGEIGGIGSSGKAGGDALGPTDGGAEPVGGGGGGGGEDAEPNCSDRDAPSSGRTASNGGANAMPGSPDLKKIWLSNSRAISAAELKSSIKPRRKIEFPSSESTEIGL